MRDDYATTGQRLRYWPSSSLSSSSSSSSSSSDPHDSPLPTTTSTTSTTSHPGCRDHHNSAAVMEDRRAATSTSTFTSDNSNGEDCRRDGRLDTDADDDVDICWSEHSSSTSQSSSLFSTTTTTSSNSSSSNISSSLFSFSPFVHVFHDVVKSSPSPVAATPFLLCLILSCLGSPCSAFNVDLKKALVHEGQANSSFGYAVAQHIDQSTNWLLIGAPQAQTSQPGVTRGGTVYRCKTNSIDSCQEVPFDNTGNTMKFDKNLRDVVPMEEKSNQWFGATIKSSGENGVIVACAPRYTYFSTDLNKREPVGMCYVAKTSTTKYEKYSPCAKGLSGFEKQGFCQAGFSAALSNDGRRLMIAAPGSWYWQGQMFEYDVVTRRPQNTNREGNSDTDYGYRGYSSAIGRFDGDDIDDYVVGIPKGHYYSGMIEMYSQNMTLLGNLTGDQIGSYFGGALAVTDLNGDRLDDIIVGAPLYTNFELSKTWDIGRVYIFYQTSKHQFKASKRDILDGELSRSRFGMALSGLGDINYDGYDDLCVGAPYAGEDRAGAIYIYHGSKKGIITKASQIIYGTDFKVPLSTFGSAISAGVDQDNNQYPDILVGAYGSDKAVFLRTRPVVKVYASLRLDPEKVNLENLTFTGANGTKGTRLEVFTCIKFEGIGVPNELYFDLEWTLDAKESNKSNAEQRAFYAADLYSFKKKETKKMKIKDTICTSTEAYVVREPGDKLSSIKTNLDFKINYKKTNRKARTKRDLQPILDAYTPTHTSFTVKILKNCGEDEICIPDLFVTYIGVDTEHVAGSKDELEFLIIVGNNGEDSFNTKLYITMPPGVDYRGKSGERSDIPITCEPLSEGSRYVVCNMGNPMARGAKSEFTFRMKPNNSNKTKESLNFNLFVNSSNPEDKDTYKNNDVSFSIPVTVDTRINLFGTAHPEELNITKEINDGRGRLVKHVFVLRSHGTSPINETKLQILWPAHDNQGRPALLLEGPLKIAGNGKCETIIITPKNSSLSRLDINTMHYDEEQEYVKIRCDNRYCTIIQCMVGYMTPYSSFSLTVLSRLRVKNFTEGRKMIDDDDVRMYHLVSMAKARVRSVPFNFRDIDKSKFPVKRVELTTKLYLNYIGSEGGVPAWVYAVAISVGILLLLLLIIILWCCGFFKRKKPDTEEGYFAVNGKNDIDSKYVD